MFETTNQQYDTTWSTNIGIKHYHSYLVGGWPTPLKNMKISWGYYSQYMEKNKLFQTTNQTNIGIKHYHSYE